MLFSSRELAAALNKRLVGTMKVIDMTPVIDAKRANAESLVGAMMTRNVGLLVMAEGEDSKRSVDFLFGGSDTKDLVGALMIRTEDGTVGSVPVKKRRTLASVVREICSVLGEEVCPICLEHMSLTGKKGFGGPSVLPCGHGMHQACLRGLVKSSGRSTVNSWGVKAIAFGCPECRKDYGMSAEQVEIDTPQIWGTQAVY